ncbi:hypothetical protein MNBD_ALPHA05-930, partial [hydrothermal vent metagenome]
FFALPVIFKILPFIFKLVKGFPLLLWLILVIYTEIVEDSKGIVLEARPSGGVFPFKSPENFTKLIMQTVRRFEGA